MNTKLSLFDGITPEEYNRMMVCFQASEKSFSTDETVCFYADHPDRIGYLLEGEAAIIRTHLDGRQTILEYLKTGDVFGSALSALSPNGDSLQVICTKSCKIQFIDYAHLIKRLQFPQSFSQQCSSADFQKSDRPWRTSGNPLSENNKRKTPVLFRKTCTGAAFRQLYAALFFKYACRLSFR